MRTPRYIIGIMLIAIFMPLAAFAQHYEKGDRRFSPEEFVQKCDCFITEQAKLTPQEAQKFLPLYHAMRDAQRKLMQEKGRLAREAQKADADEKQSLKTLDRLLALDRQITDIEQEYQKKILKVIPASKYLKVKIAEKKFERKILHKMAPRPAKK